MVAHFLLFVFCSSLSFLGLNLIPPRNEVWVRKSCFCAEGHKTSLFWKLKAHFFYNFFSKIYSFAQRHNMSSLFSKNKITFFCFFQSNLKNIFAICEIGFIFHKMELEMLLNFFYFQLPYFVYPIILWSIHNYFAFVIFNFLTMNEDKRSIPFSFKGMIEC